MMTPSGSGRILKRDDLDSADTRIQAFGAESVPPSDVQPEPEVTIEPADDRDGEEVDRVRRLVQAMLRGFAQQRREILAELQPYVVRIAVEVARRIVRRELRADPGLIARTAQAALEQMAGASDVRVRVHPLDAQVLETTMHEVVSSRDDAAGVTIVPDGSVERGGCVVESDRGIVDARLRTQFEEMQARLFDSVEPHEGEGEG
ncbi:MAG: FliH/SctL family protein [Armatimonadota bacterium]|nr:FliH/SctL family protein [Armatimonadota bacterium]